MIELRVLGGESLLKPLKIVDHDGDSPDPPFLETYKKLFATTDDPKNRVVAMEDCQLPIIDLRRLTGGETEIKACQEEIFEAAKTWGFFQVVNHGVSGEVLEKMRKEQVSLMRKPFRAKIHGGDLGFAAGNYRWGTPSATCLKQLSWSEAFHVCLNDVVESTGNTDLRWAMENFSIGVSKLCYQLVDILADAIDENPSFFREACSLPSSYLRLNRYPACPEAHQVLGITPHTDSDFITVLHQDHIGGLQLLRDGKWIAVKPNSDALIINIGDLLQAWSNDVYKSVKHRVVTNATTERFSTAFFFCPSYDTVIHGATGEPVYRSFSFGEYRKQVQEDTRIFGDKIGLPRFHLHTN